METIDLFDRGADLYPDRDCFVSEARNFTFAEVRARSERIAAALVAAGLDAGAKVAVFSPNDPLGFVCVLGLLRAGLVWIPLNPRNSASDNQALLDAFDCEVLLFHSELGDAAADLTAGLPHLKLVLCIDRVSGLAESLDDWCDARPGPWRPRRVPDGDAVAALVGTGGTTGLPKGVMLTHRNIEAFVAAFLACLPSPNPPTYLVAAPMTHGAGFLAFAMMVQGATTVVLPNTEPQALLRTIEARGVTDLFLPPTAIYNLLAQPNVRDFDYSSLRHFFYSAAPMSVEKLKEAIEVFGPVMTQSYGQTEAPNFCTILSPAEHFRDGRLADDGRLASCGRATPFVTVGIMGGDGEMMSDGEPGEVVIRGGIVMKGYYKNPDATAEASRHGWHHTGDVGFLDPEGYLHIVDRTRDMIISGGFNIYPSEVEQVIWTHPAVEDCAVVGVPDEKWGEAVKAVVELKADHSASAEELLALCRSRLGGVKTPKSVEFWDTLPRSPVGKVLKRAIRDRYWPADGRKV